ncbi:hypothetical protein GRI75_09510 [Altererythrobacter soli]|uniref:MobA/MobL protein domain-containing protein n=1 Tax=Croceibacterium soli TaxID=1739690 RepID=A0A6I4UWS6_9SPHN|nr:hypothetical protein [Croceibacterium soli]MXP41877.1 hypothetical protein [Croceibacterium soli]
MATKKHAPPPGLDYAPITGAREDLSFGVVQATTGTKKVNTAEGAMFRRLYPILKPDEPALPWSRPTCFRHDVLLPFGASDDWYDPQRLARAYDEQGFSLVDLVVVVTLRFPEVEALPQPLRLHDVWEMTRAFTLERLVRAHNVGAVCVMHVPARAARPGAPHVHVLIPAREVLPTGFGKFARPLATDQGRELLDAEWAAWRDASNG